MKEILLGSRDKNIKKYVIVSGEDYEHLNKFKWSYKGGDYVRASVKDHGNITIHKYIITVILKLKIPKNNDIDHKNNNKLDNSR